MGFSNIASVFLISKEPKWKPESGLVTYSDGWKAINNDPQFVCSTLAWIPGWYMLELEVEYEFSSETAMLYFDTGQGFSDDKAIRLPLHSGQLFKRLVYFPAGLRSIRFDPSVQPGTFKFHRSKFVWLTPWKAREIVLHYLSTADTRYQGYSSKQLINKLQDDALEGQSWWEWAVLQYEHRVSHVTVAKDYTRWQERQFEINRQLARQLQDEHHEWKMLPCVSIILPVFNTPPQLLESTISSVLSQSYANWQLCIADDASSHAETRETLQRFAVQDERISVVWRESNGHISAASQSALESATGDYIALLDHDDLLDPDALLFVVEAINLNPDARLIYTDEDKIDAEGEFFDPHFKPDWNPDLLLSQNYISHLSVFEAKHLRSVGGFRVGFEGSQDHDLLLRFCQNLKPVQIVHIPRVLYHWRALEGSTAFNADAKGYTQQAGLRAVADHLLRLECGAQVEAGMAANTYRVVWPIPEPQPLVSLLIPTRDGLDILKPCVEALLEHTDYQNLELLIIDNQSSCPLTLAYLEELPSRDQRVRVLRWDHPFNYSAINNYAAGHAQGSILGLVNNDIEPVNAGWLREMVAQVSRTDIGCVGAKLYYPDGSLQHAGVILGLGGVAGHSHKHFPRHAPGYFRRLILIQNLSAVTAACLLVRKSVFDQVGGLNEEQLKVAFNDVDFCLRVRAAGYRNLWTPYAELYHHESISRGADNTPEKQQRFRSEIAYMRATWSDVLDQDPAYNPNLTLDTEDFGLR